MAAASAADAHLQSAAHNIEMAAAAGSPATFGAMPTQSLKEAAEQASSRRRGGPSDRKKFAIVVAVMGVFCALMLWLANILAADADDDRNRGPLYPDGVVPDISRVGFEAVKSWTINRVQEAQRAFRLKMKRHEPSPNDWSNSVIYNIQVDRFNNGNLSNDAFNIPKVQQERVLRQVHHWRHGGDLEGIIQRLDYLAHLGINTLWITPILKHSGEYHGYCLSDPAEVDPGFGTQEDFQRLVVEAHKRRMRVVLDIVVNHICDGLSGYVESNPRDPGMPVIVDCAEAQMDAHFAGVATTAEVLHQSNLSFADTFFPAFREQTYFSRCGPCLLEQMQGDKAITVFGDYAHGMFDIDTRNWYWQEIFTNLMKYWIAFADVDGFRLDAAKHVTEDFLAYFSTEIRLYADLLGKSNFLVLGEVAGHHVGVARRLGSMMSNPRNPLDHETRQYLPDDVDHPKRWGVARAVTERLKVLKDRYLQNLKFPYPGLSSIYHFHQSGKAKDVLHGELHATDLQWYLSGNEELTTMAGQLEPFCKSPCPEALSQMWTVLEIHDWPRFLERDPSDQTLAQLGLAWLMTAPGQPVVYYGQEQGFNGDCVEGSIRIGGNDAVEMERDTCPDQTEHSRHRQDMFQSGPWRLGSAVDAVNRLAFIGDAEPEVSGPWQEDPFLPRDHAIYRAARALIHFRRSCYALRRGTIIVREAEDERGGFFVYSRIANKNEVIVALNPTNESRTLSVVNVSAAANTDVGRVYSSVMHKDGGSFSATVAREGEDPPVLQIEPPIEVPSRGFVILMPARLKEWSPELGIALCRRDGPNLEEPAAASARQQAAA